MCAACQAEYGDPADRRFHAQPNACPACGPRLALLDRAGHPLAEREAALEHAVGALTQGQVVAVKGLGGFHLACVARDESAVARLRARKHREEKPFALMARDLDAARELAQLTEREEDLLTSPQRPIVLAPRRPGAPVAEAVAPRSRDLGVMLPYSPLHHLLLADLGQTLVMTSGNVSDEPIAYRDDDALVRLAGIAELFLLHDRAIETRTDDSVARAVSRRTPLLIRRSRGYAPAPLRLPVAAERPVLGCGAELKSTFCVARGSRAWVSHHIGDLENFETLRSFTEGIGHFQRLFAIRPEVVAYDLHPEYLSTKYAHELPEVELVGVQHHHAHLAACLAEHGEFGPAVSAVYDGTGYGTDGTIWGGELLVGDLHGFERAGHLWPVRLPGGAAAVREPWRMARSWQLAAVGSPDAPPPEPIRRAVGADAWETVGELCARGLAAPQTTSVGRLFDAVAALSGVRLRVSYEGQAAAELESACDPAERGIYPMPLAAEGELVLIDARQTILAALEDIGAGAQPPTIAARFHNALAATTAAALMLIAARHGLELVVLSGGTFQNRVLLDRVGAQLRHAGLRVLTPERLPCNDGGVAYGQAAVAAARMSEMGTAN
jgi:hydrogenase maturation protein HypF